MISFEIYKSLGSFTLDCQAVLPAEGITAIFGRSGSGKTSLINCISGLIPPDRGNISINDKALFCSKNRVCLAPDKRRIGYVFQDARLFPHYRVTQNLRYGQKTKADSKAQFDDIVELLDLNALLHRYPSQLSGGEKQRVAIGRALLTQPDLLLMDEPTAALDIPRKKELMQYLLRLVKQVNMPILYVTHHLDEIIQLADHLLLIDNGKVITSGSLTEVWHSEMMSPWFEEKERSALVLADVVEVKNAYGLTELVIEKQSLWLPAITVDAASQVRLRIFANDISISRTYPDASSIRNVLSVTISHIYQLENNAECRLTLNLGQQVVFANITLWAMDELSLTVGDKVFAQLKGMSLTKKDVIVQQERDQTLINI